MPGTVAADLWPAAILDAFEDYTGSITDLDRKTMCLASDLRAKRDRLLDWFRERGLYYGDRVIVSVGNGPAFVTTLAATLSAGASPLLLHAETPPAELARFARTFGARAVLSEACGPADLQVLSVDSAQVSLDRFPDLTWAAVDQNHPDFDGNWPELPPVPLHPTSGTTGKPKVAVRPGAAAVAEARNYQETLQTDENDRILCFVPMSHAYGFGTSVMLPLISGASVVSMRRFNPRAVERALREHEITTFPAVPAMLDLFLLGAGDAAASIPRRVLSAGAPLPERTARAFLEKTGRAVTPLYGTTETGGISIAVGGGAPAMATCVGPAMRAVQAEIRPLAHDGGIPSGVGRVRIKSPSMMAGYLTPGGIDDSLIVEGWFETGDLGFFDKGRRIHLVGREKEVINVFGMKVVPSEVEEVIAAFPQVTDVKVYAGVHRTGSQIVKAAIAAPETFDVAALKRHCTQNLAPYKRPEIIIRLEALPRSPTGKIIKDQLP
jgi:acyl-CoA synthetase (AMP-forming)/AMP-acid ligase II